MSAPCGCDRVDWLCGCGTGRMAVPECEVPAFCPLCDAEIGGPGNPCGEDVDAREVAREVAREDDDREDAPTLDPAPWKGEFS